MIMWYLYLISTYIWYCSAPQKTSFPLHLPFPRESGLFCPGEVARLQALVTIRTIIIYFKMSSFSQMGLDVCNDTKPLTHPWTLPIQSTNQAHSCHLLHKGATTIQKLGVWIGQSPNQGCKAIKIWGRSPNLRTKLEFGGEAWEGEGGGSVSPSPDFFCSFCYIPDWTIWTSNCSIWYIVET